MDVHSRLGGQEVRRFALLIFMFVSAVGVVATMPDAPRCEEDQACWDCSTMGNLVCGPTFGYQAVIGSTPVFLVGVDSSRQVPLGWLIL